MAEREVYRAMAGLFQVSREQVIAKVQSSLPELDEESPPRSGSLKLVPVRSYIGSGMKTLRSGTFPGILVPPFAVHWGVAVGNTLYHLTFRNRAHADIESSDFARYGKPIEFTMSYIADDSLDRYPVVGQSKLDHEARLKVGNALIQAFGDYHRLFWNCQVWAECFLYFITGKNSFGEYASGRVKGFTVGGLPQTLHSCFCALL